MRVLGVDPGTVRMGYGVVEGDGDAMQAVDFGVVTAPASMELADRLARLYDGLTAVLARHRPDAVAIEEPFVARNVRSAMLVGEARALALLAAARQGVPVRQYSPAEVKQAVTGHGASPKDQVQTMVRLLLRLDAVPQPHDAADALAVAICHARRLNLERVLEGGR